MTVQDHVAAARAAAKELGRAVGELRRELGDTIDLRRLETDVDRLGVDIDLLAGPERSGPPRELEVIPDTDYPAEFWADCEDEGVGRQR